MGGICDETAPLGLIGLQLYRQSIEFMTEFTEFIVAWNIMAVAVVPSCSNMHAVCEIIQTPQEHP